MPKQTRLDEKAAIYQPRKMQTEKEKLKDMPLRKKFSYLWEYYKLPGVVILAAISLTAYIIYLIITPNVYTKFNATILDSTVNIDAVAKYGQDFSEYLKLDPKTEIVVLNDALNSSFGLDYASNIQQTVSTYIAAQEIDVIIAPVTEFEGYAYSEYFAKLSDELPTDVYSELTDYFYITNVEGDPDKNAYGIYLTDSDLFKNATYEDEPYVLGIVANYQNKENTIEFIKYLFKDLKKNNRQLR